MLFGNSDLKSIKYAPKVVHAMEKAIAIKVKPNSSQSKIVEENGNIVVHVKAPPENNKANLEVIKLFSKLYKNVKIIKGLSSKRKLLRCEV